MKLKTLGLILSIVMLFQYIAIGQSNPFLNAQIAYEKQQFMQAVDYLNQHIISYPKHSKALLLRAKANAELGNYQSVIDDLLKLKISEDDEIYLLNARAYSGLNKNDLAIDQLEKYLGTNSKLPESTVKSYREFNVLKSTEKWSVLWKEEHYSAKESILENARFAIKSGNYGEAEDRLNEYLAKYSRNAEAFFLRGNVFFHLKNYKSASDNYYNALQLNPDNQKYLTALALCNNKLEKYRMAQELLNKVYATDSLYLPASLARAEAYNGLGQFESAKSDITRYRLYYPENTDAQFLEAQIDTKSGDFLSAISNYGKLIRANPGKAEYFVARANAYMLTKTYKYAIKDYSMALDLEPKNVEVYKLKARAHQLAGESNQACAEWQYAAKLGDIESMDNLHKFCK